MTSSRERIAKLEIYPFYINFKYFFFFGKVSFKIGLLTLFTKNTNFSSIHKNTNISSLIIIKSDSLCPSHIYIYIYIQLYLVAYKRVPAPLKYE